MPGPHEVLGVAVDASEAEIRRAYREALLRTHPDKGGDAEQFRRVQEAYEALGAGAEGHAAEDDGFLGAVAKACKEMWRRKLVRDLSVHLDLEVTLAEVYSGTTKKLQYVARAGGVSERRSVLVKLADFKPAVTYPGMGDSLCGMAGDLVLSLRVAEAGAMRIDDVNDSLDLYADLYVGLGEFLFGGRVPLALPDGRAEEVAVPSMLLQGGSSVVTLRGLGLPSEAGGRGDVIVVCHLDRARLDVAADDCGLCSCCAAKLRAARPAA